MTDHHEDLLIRSTGEGCQYWMDFIGAAIPKHTRPSDNPLHGSTESNLWLRDLADEVFARMKPYHDLAKMDENIIVSSLVSLILTLWSCRVRRAKSYDPRRPLDVRRAMTGRLYDYHHALLDCIVNEASDHHYFPAQEWDPPFAPGAKDGDFV